MGYATGLETGLCLFDHLIVPLVQVEGMCFASEGFAIQHAGWMGGAIEASTHCFRSEGPLFEYLSDVELAKTWNNDCLTVQSCINECVMLSNEKHLRDIATNGLWKKQCKSSLT